MPSSAHPPVWIRPSRFPSPCWASLQGDTYDHVLSGWNTALRLDGEYRALADRVLEDPAFPINATLGTAVWRSIPTELLNSTKAASEVPDYALNQDELILDHIYDIPALGRQAGHLILYLEAEQVSFESAANIMLDLKARFDEAGGPVRGDGSHRTTAPRRGWTASGRGDPCGGLPMRRDRSGRTCGPHPGGGSGIGGILRPGGCGTEAPGGRTVPIDPGAQEDKKLVKTVLQRFSPAFLQDSGFLILEQRFGPVSQQTTLRPPRPRRNFSRRSRPSLMFSMEVA